jgi:hypothetical protein
VLDVASPRGWTASMAWQNGTVWRLRMVDLAERPA